VRAGRKSDTRSRAVTRVIPGGITVTLVIPRGITVTLVVEGRGENSSRAERSAQAELPVMHNIIQNVHYKKNE